MPDFGDWDAPGLILAQDCGLADALRERIRNQHPQAHGYGEKVITNTKLRKIVEQAGIRSTLLYGSVLGSLWRKTGSKRRKPPGWEELLPTFVVPAIRWVVGSMDKDHLRAIGCMGEYAWIGVMAAADRKDLQNTSEWKFRIRNRASVEVEIANRTVRAYAMFHPAYPRSYELLSTNWPEMARVLKD